VSIQTTYTREAAAQDAILANINSGSSAAGYVTFRTGSIPANVAATRTGTLLSTCVIGSGSTPAFGATNTGTLVATGQTTAGYFAQDASPANTGTAGYFTLYDYNNVAVLQGTVGVAGSGADMIFNTLTITAGVLVVINSFNITVSGSV
jgi:hypothetical protein